MKCSKPLFLEQEKPLAVYTQVTAAALETFLASYAIGTLKAFHGIAEGIENSNFLLETTSGTYILTLYEKRVHPEDLPFFLSLLSSLAASGFPCPVPIFSPQGNALNILCDRPAAIVSFLHGKATTVITTEHCIALGKTLAALHLGAQHVLNAHPNRFSLSAWQSLYQQTQHKADTVMPGLSHLIAEELAFLEQYWPKDLPSGIIHGDLFPDNVFFEGPTLTGVIDFYFACHDFWIYDVAICINAWCFDKTGTFNVTHASALLKAYHEVRPVTVKEHSLLPVIARGAALRFLLTRLFDWLHRIDDALVTPKDPMEYVRKLQSLQQNILPLEPLFPLSA